MKKTILITLMAIALAAVSGAAYGAEGGDYKQVAAALSQRLDEFTVSTGQWKYREKCSEKCFQPVLEKELKWKTAAPGMYWPEAFQEFWFRKTYTVPDKVAGRSVAGARITLTMNVSDGADVYVDGVKVGGNEGAVIAESAAPGREIVLGARVTNGTWPGAYMSTRLNFSTFDNIASRTRAFLNRINEAETLIARSGGAPQWNGILDKATARVNLDAFMAYNEPAYFASLDAALAEMQQLAPLYKNYTLYLDGYSHIDLAWLWDKAEGEIVVRDTLNTVFTLYDEYPDWIFTFSQAHALKWMEDDYPEIFQKVKDYYEQGRLEFVGGTWTEHDSNLPGGEGFARQFLYGKRYFRDKFGKDITIAWTPDSFGYNGNLPQFLVKSGMTGFLTQKLGSNESTRFPHKIFWWQGVDGSRILTYFPPGGYADGVNRTPLVAQMAGIEDSHGVREQYVVFGVGNHGGGVTRGHLDRALEIMADPASPNLRWTSAEDYFAHLRDLAKTHEFPTWNDELYLEHHRGTYTTQSDVKKNNRQVEQLLVDAEKLAVLSNVNFNTPYPAERLFNQGWYFLLLNHMHDILPGSGITKVYEDANKDYGTARATANDVIKTSLDTLAAHVNTQGTDTPVIVFNTLSWPRDAIVEIPVDTLRLHRAFNEDGALPTQITEKNGIHHLLFIARNLPAYGYSVYTLKNTSQMGMRVPDTDTNLVCSADSFENKFTKITFEPATGAIKSLFDKQLDREMMSPDSTGNVVQAFEDTQNAWEIQFNVPIEIQPSGSAEIIEKGPVRCTVKFTKTIRNSTVTQFISLYAGDPLVYGRIDMDWKDHNVTTKLAFPLNLLNKDAWFEIPYAAISRKAIPETAADKAKFEVSAHRWVDYTDQDGSAGVSLLNDSKYGFDVKKNVLRMTLLRTPVTPDPEADIGMHTISYALYPHAGDWRAADTPRRGAEFNAPPYIVTPGAHDGELPAAFSFFSADADNVMLTAVKRAEDGDGIILRLVETEGRKATTRITLPWSIASAFDVNLIEDPVPSATPIAVESAALSLELGPFEIRTVKLTL